MNVTLEVEYYDAAAGSLAVEFDASDSSAPFNGAYSPSAETINLAGSKTWKTGKFALNGAGFLNGSSWNNRTFQWRK